MGILNLFYRMIRYRGKDRSERQMYLKVLIEFYEGLLTRFIRTTRHLCRYRSVDQREHIAPVPEMKSAFQARLTTTYSFSLVNADKWPDYLTLPSTSQSAQTYKNRLPPLPTVFTRPTAIKKPSITPVPEWLDPQLLGGPAMQPTGKAAGSRSDTGTMFRLEAADRIDGGPRPKRDRKRK